MIRRAQTLATSAPGVQTPACSQPSALITTARPRPCNSWPEARTVLITPFDRGAVNEIIQAIRDADLGVNPNDDGKVIRVNLPALTEERRREYVKQAKGRAEEGRISVRAARRKAKDQIDSMKKDGDIGEDEADRAEKALELLTKEKVDQIDEALDAKEADLLEV